MKFVKTLPPASTGSRQRISKIDADVAELRKRPGHWALIYENAYNTSAGNTYARRGCEVTTRKHEVGGKCDIYAMWPVGRSEQYITVADWLAGVRPHD